MRLEDHYRSELLKYPNRETYNRFGSAAGKLWRKFLEHAKVKDAEKTFRIFRQQGTADGAL